MALSARKQAFIEYYIGEAKFNGAEAARMAGYPERSARQQASRLLTNDDIQAAIKQRIDEIAMTSHEVLVRLSDHARGSMADFIDQETGLPDILTAAKNDKLHLLKKVKYVTRTQVERGRGDDEPEITRIDTIEFELYDKQDALVHLGRYHKLFIERQEHTGKDGGPIKHRFTGLEDVSDDELDALIKE